MSLFSNYSYGDMNTSLWDNFDGGPSVFDMDNLINNLASFVDADTIKSTSPLTYAIIVLYTASFLCGLTGNVTALCVVTKYYKMNRASGLLLISLLVSNIMAVVICLPFTMLSHIHGEWIHGQVSCKLLPFLQGASVFSGIFVLFALTIQQFCGKYFPQIIGKTFSTYGTRLIVMLTWAVAFLLPSPLLYVNELKTHELMGILTVSMCNEVWPHEYSRHMYNITIFILTYIIPHFIFLVGYIRMMLSNDNPTNGRSANHIRIEAIHSNERRNAQLILARLIGMFALLWLPYHVIIIYLDIHVGEENVASLGTYVFPVVQWLALSNAAFHPICYCLMAPDYRTLLHNFCLCKTDIDTELCPKGLFLQPGSLQQPDPEVRGLEECDTNDLITTKGKEFMEVETVV